jgi:type IV pilus assembly protein PilC
MPIDSFQPTIFCIHYRASDAKRRVRTGRFYALSMSDAQQQFSHMGLTPLRVKSRVYQPNVFQSTFTVKQLNEFSTQLATLLASSISLEQSLNIMRKGSSNAAQQRVLCRILLAITSGLSLSDSLRMADKKFDGFYANLVQIAEAHGDLAGCFNDLATLQQKSQRLKKRVTKVLIYPALVTVVAMIVCYLMLTQVIPEFEQMFISLGGSLPSFTQYVLTLSHWLQAHSLTIVLWLLSLFGSLSWIYQRNALGRHLMHKYALAIPLVGDTLKQLAWCRICQTLAITLAAGMPLLHCLACAKISCTNDYIKQKITLTCSLLESGNTLSQSLHDSELFDQTRQQLLSIGEQSGQLEKMLIHGSEQLTQSIDSKVDHLSQLIEPVMIVTLGSIVGSLVIAMYLPIFELMNHLG